MSIGRNRRYVKTLLMNHLWERLKHENELINHRLGWLWTTQAFLFAAFAVLSKDIFTQGTLPITIICTVGIFTCTSVGYSVFKASQVIGSINLPLAVARESLSLEAPELRVKEISANAFVLLHPWFSVPWLLAICWLLLLYWVYA